jgi:hypothetical protein
VLDPEAVLEPTLDPELPADAADEVAPRPDDAPVSTYVESVRLPPPMAASPSRPESRLASSRSSFPERSELKRVGERKPRVSIRMRDQFETRDYASCGREHRIRTRALDIVTARG